MLYDRLAAVRYADKWWNSYNPAYPKFDVDCTNYVSQCLRAGGAPMWGYPNREKGWWIGGGTWSLSWSTPHSLRWYLAGSKRGMTATQVGSAEELELGDIIVYDFQNDGRYDHSTIVTAKNGSEPLVNAHTYNVKHRTGTIKIHMHTGRMHRYIFFKINDNFT